MGAGRRDQGGGPLDQGEGIEPHGPGSVGKGFSQAVEEGVEAGRRTGKFVAGRDVVAFRADARTHFAVIAQIQIIREAAKPLSDAFRTAHPDVPWNDIAGMRDVLIHLHDRVDLDEVWRTATADVPDLLAFLEPLLPSGPR